MRGVFAVAILVAALLSTPSPSPASAPDVEVGSDRRAAAAPRPDRDRRAERAERAVPSGRWLLDGRGRALVLHGVNMVYKLDPYAPDTIGFGADDARFLKRIGFTTVRLGLIWRAVEPRPGRYDDRYLARIRRTVDVLAKQGIWTMLDFHQDLYHERFQGEGAPTWAVLDDGLPNQPQLGFPNNYFVMPGLNRSFDNFWDNAAGPGGVGLQDRYAAAWAHVVRYMRQAPMLLGVDLFNEPWPGTGWQACANTEGCPLFDAKLEAFDQRVIKAIRKVDSRTAIFYEPHVLFNNGVPTGAVPSGKRLAFSFHDYCLTADVGLGEAAGDDDPVCDEFNDLVWVNVRKHVAKTGHPAVLSEFGATRSQPTLRDMVLRAQKSITGWQYWAYCGCDDPTTTGPGATQALVYDPSKPPRGKNLDHAKLRALVVPHPLVVAGTPRRVRYDRDSRLFVTRWRTARPAGSGSFGAGARSVVSVPRLVYRKGYTVRVFGARVVSRPNAPRLVLAQRAGAHKVVVRVRPR